MADLRWSSGWAPGRRERDRVQGGGRVAGPPSGPSPGRCGQNGHEIAASSARLPEEINLVACYIPVSGLVGGSGDDLLGHHNQC